MALSGTAECSVDYNWWPLPSEATSVGASSMVVHGVRAALAV